MILQSSTHNITAVYPIGKREGVLSQDNKCIYTSFLHEGNISSYRKLQMSTRINMIFANWEEFY